MDIFSVSVGFLIGAFTAAGGTYLAGIFTDQRKRQDAKRAELRAFEELAAQMPTLFRAIKTDLEAEDMAFTREVFLLPTSGAQIGMADKAYFKYVESENAALREKFDLLDQASFVTDITRGNAPKFRLSESFVAHLKAWRPS